MSTENEKWVAKIQVTGSHYSAKYDDWDKWTNYWWQIRQVVDHDCRDVLEIGVGSRVVSSYLLRNGFNLSTMDIDPRLQPDYVGDITQLSFADNSFDAVLCCEVLEHMPFEQSCKALAQIHRVTRKFAFITVPHFCLTLALLVRLPKIHLREMRLRLPFKKTLRPGGEHYWEIGRPGYPVRKLESAIRDAGFSIISNTRQMTNYSHCFFVLEKRP